MSTLLIKNIHQLVTCDDEDRVLQNADLYCEDGFIKAIGTALDVTADRGHRRQPYALLPRPSQYPPPPVPGVLPQPTTGTEHGAV